MHTKVRDWSLGKKVGDKVGYTRRDYPGGTTLTRRLSGKIVKFGKKKVKIKLDKPYTSVKRGFRRGKTVTEVWVEPHNVGLPMRKGYRKGAFGCLTLVIVGFLFLIGCITFVTIVIFTTSIPTIFP